MLKFFWWALLWGLFIGCIKADQAVRSSGFGFDGVGVGSINTMLDAGGTTLRRGVYIRVRAHELLTASGSVPTENPVEKHRDNLSALHNAGMRSIVLLRWPPAVWAAGTRSERFGLTLPLDLREAFSRCRELAAAYGDLVDFWEIDNEPDISFVQENPETYAAFLKACALGIRRGLAERTIAASPGEAGDHSGNVRNGPRFHKFYAGRSIPPKRRDVKESQHERVSRMSRVLMAPLALPPGPYLEAIAANDGLGFTDGFNFHYYGYAEDFFGVYLQFKSAVGEQAKNRRGLKEKRKSIPVFITEYGYGLLSRPAADTVAGRVRQWKWFRSVSEQICALKITGPLAFYLPPYLENGVNEFGLTTSRRKTTDLQKEEDTSFSAGGLRFHPVDFGATKAEPWMSKIGAKIADNEATPALAWLLGVNSHYTPRQWPIRAALPSSIVIDFVAGEGVLQVKQCQGYFLRGVDGFSSGQGEIRVYNFGEKPVVGQLALGVYGTSESLLSALTLAPGEMKSLPVTVRVPAVDLRAHPWHVEFRPEMKAEASARFSTVLYPDVLAMRREVLDRFDASAETTRNAKLLSGRAYASEEPPEAAVGRWRLTDGVSITEADGVWRFTIAGFPKEPLRPAIAELVLPDHFQLPDDALLELEYRLVPRTAAAQVLEPRSPIQQGSLEREAFGVYWRTENGNLYTVWRAPSASFTWQRYAQMKRSFTMAFYGRAHLPWRFADNRPASLVFQFRPNYLPATYEVRRAQIVRYVQQKSAKLAAP